MAYRGKGGTPEANIERREANGKYDEDKVRQIAFVG
jgi:hypothetical protein